MLEVMLCSAVTVLPDFLYRRYGQGKRLGHEITLFSVWYELRWGITLCAILAVALVTTAAACSNDDGTTGQVVMQSTRGKQVLNKARETIPTDPQIWITAAKLEAGVGDRLAPMPAREFSNYAPHAPQGAVGGQIVSIYGDGLTAGQNQIVALNKGSADGLERGHVLALWSTGEQMIDKTDPSRPTIKLPDERHGMLFVFRVFEHMSYALILNVQEPVKPGDRFTQP